jgi:ribonuclease HII
MIAGADEVGRGPVFGPMVLCGVLLDEKILDELKAAGVKDSKLLTPKRRETLAKLIEERVEKFEIVELSPAEIDELRIVKKVNLNEIEAMNFAKILDYLKPEIAYVDSADPNPAMFKERIERHMKTRTSLVVENYADSTYVVVAAASVVAKVRRDARIAELSRKYGDLGSGYSSDPRTMSFLERWVREHGKLPDFARKSWKPAKRVDGEAKQRKLI